MADREQKHIRRRWLYTKPLFLNTIFVAVVTTLAVWLLGLGSHRTLFVNSLLSVSLLSFFFLLFLVSGLYRGVKLKDDMGKVLDRYRPVDLSSGLNLGDGCSFDGEGILAWIGAAIAAIVLIWILGSVLWLLILVFAAMLYWIFFRALRLVFRKGPLCRGNLPRSLLYGLYYTVLYNCWIYGIILGGHYLVNHL
ncbi:hypothetical protein [Taibaiella koreensis]|uniref:hypothetical protein n=1 Tax=Taibaiella koreensis TaxID=1268548 RepID=UPI0013C3028E|nr:hypothetical protein [Taibaiella koreensis]